MIAITGATGLLGVYLLAEFVQHGHAARGLYRDDAGLHRAKHVLELLGMEQVFAKVHWVQGSLEDPASIDALLEGASGVIHAAGTVSFSPKARRTLERTNITGTESMVNAALELEPRPRFIQISSVAALGRSEKEEVITEASHCTDSAQNSHYAYTKFAAEREVWRGFEEGLTGAILNPSIILGAGSWETSSARLIHTVYHGFPFYSEGVNSVVDAGDVARSARILMERSEINHQRFITAGPPISYRNLLFAIADALGVKRPRYSPPRWVSGLAWRLEAVRTFFTRTEPMLTRETVLAGHGKSRYDAARAREVLGVDFKDAQAILSSLAPLFLKDQRERS